MHSTWSKETGKSFNLEQCLFGEHLLSDALPFSKVALVESEKTALIGSIVEPSYLWLATGGLSNLSPKKLEVVRDYRVTAFPDKGSADYWENKLVPLGIEVSNVLEYREDIKEGDDLADIWIELQKQNSKLKF
jgi:hypothetical protein